MKSQVRTETVVILTLDQNEAKWLTEVMQNPIHEGEEGEDPYDAEMRLKFFASIPADIRRP